MSKQHPDDGPRHWDAGEPVDEFAQGLRPENDGDRLKHVLMKAGRRRR